MFTFLNLRGVETSAAINRWLAIGMSVVVAWMLLSMVYYLTGLGHHSLAFFTKPFYDPSTFSAPAVLTGTSIAALSYIGFDSISTLSEETINPQRNILRATVLVCFATGVFSAIEVYAGQLVWPDFNHFPDLDTAYSFVAGRAGGPLMFHLVNGTLLIANAASGMGAQLGAARLLFGMGRDNTLPARFFGYVDPKTKVPSRNVLFTGALALIGAHLISYQLGAELLNFGAFLAFTAVNLSAFMHYFVRGKNRHWSYFALPVAGCAVCIYIWSSLRWQAQIIGLIWLVAGAVYAFVRRSRTA
jgi:amino acid transporter